MTSIIDKMDPRFERNTVKCKNVNQMIKDFHQLHPSLGKDENVFDMKKFYTNRKNSRFFSIGRKKLQ